MNAVGAALRTWGKSLDRLGVSLQGKAAYVETLVPSTRVVAVGDKAPKVASDAFIAPSASVVGDVTIGSSSSVWYNAVLRSDKGGIKVGNNTNIQERAVVVPSSGSVSVGNGVTIGASAQLDSCTLQDGCMVGVGVQLASGSVVESGSVVAAGSVVTANTRIASGQLWSGNPAQYLRDLSPEEQASLLESANELSALGSYHGAETDKSWEQISDEKEAWKKHRLSSSGDTIMNPSENHFEERPGLIFHQENDAVVTHTEVEQKEIDKRVFNRNRQ